MQNILGVKADGIWGPKTQAAYEAWSENTSNKNKSKTSEKNMRNAYPTPQKLQPWYNKAHQEYVGSKYVDKAYDNSLMEKAKNIVKKAFNNKIINSPQYVESSLTGDEASDAIIALGVDMGIDTAVLVKITKLLILTGISLTTPLTMGQAASIATTAVGAFSSQSIEASKSISDFIYAMELLKRNGGYKYSGYSFAQDTFWENSILDYLFYADKEINPLP